MTDEKEIFKKITNLFEDSKKKKITDYDKGLLYDVFEPITGGAEEKFDRWSDRLIRVATRLENLSKTKNRPKVLDDIYTFFDDLKLPSISSEIKDDSVTIKYGRTLRIERGDGGKTSTCPSELYNDTARQIRQEQYIPLIAKIKTLFAKAMAELKDSEFEWHKAGVIKEIEPTMITEEGKTDG